MCLLQAGEPEWRRDAFTDSGKWMDGWETRRRRIPGHDWAVIRLGQRSNTTERDICMALLEVSRRFGEYVAFIFRVEE
jgi:allantoicase